MSERVPVLINIAIGDPRPIGRQIVDSIRRQIASGELPVGAILPTVRGLAQQLSVNPNTIAKAYNELSAEGWVDARQSLGVFVAPQRQLLSDPERAKRLKDAIDHFVGEIIALNYPAAEVLKAVDQELQQFPPKEAK
jgi:GntR family transcriptional regulator